MTEGESLAADRRQPHRLHDVGGNQLLDAGVEGIVGLLQRRCAADRQFELAADGGTDLGDVLGRRIEPVEPGQQRALQRIGNGNPLERALELIMAADFAPDIFLEHRLGQFLDEQRHTVGPIDDLIEHEVGERLSGGELFDHRLTIAARKAIEVDLHELRIVPVGPELRPRRHQQQQARASQALLQLA